jgi:amino acid adenylation domain-containing protein
VDHQVQIRGFRVELGEIEKRLKEIEHIKEALVLERETEIPGGKNYLCAYVVSEKQVDIPGLRTILSKSLPGFMIPAYFVQISGIPLTTNGKVDRKALPEPGTTGSQDDYTAPGNEIEETLQDIWSALLDIEKHRISVTANFFQLGGHSLKATILIAKVHKAFNLGITLGEMFKKPTIRGLSGYIKSRTGEDRHTSIKPVERKEYYTLSSPQQRLYILQQMDQTATVYNLPLVVGLEGPVDENRLGYTFERLIQRHESFRTSVEMVQGEPVQRIHQGARVEVKIEEKDIGLAASTIENFIRPFDLSRAPLLRVGLIKVEAGKYILMVDMHHIITDGISLRIFTKEFLTLYPGQQLPPLSLQYKDYSQWQTGEEKRKAPGKQEEYWLKQFEGEIPVLALPMDFVRPAVQRFEGKTVTFEIGKRETDAVRQIAAAEGATLFMVLITLYYIFLSKISSQEDIVIGTPVAGRRHTDLEPIIGMFVNTLALRNYPTGEKDFHAFLLEVKERILPAFDNQLYPFEDLVEELGPQVNKDVGRNPLFDVMFVLDDGDITDIKIPGLQLVPYPYENRTAKFDLTLQAIQLEEGLRFNLEYSAALFKEDAIQRFTGYFKRVVSAVVEDVKKKISRIEIISSQEKEQLLVDFNNTEAQYPKNKTIHELFEEQVERIPDRTSLVGGHETHEKHEENHNMSHMSYMSYKELNEKTHRLAFKLKQKGVKPDTIVAIMAERSIETIIGIFGILKAGGAFLFIDPEYPQERVNYVLKDSNAGVLLTTPKLQVKAKVEVKENIRKPGRLPLQFLNIEAFPSTLTSTSTCRVSPTNLAYIIYTSGSTGKPKAVIVGHSSVVNLLFVLQEQYPFRESDAYPLKTSILFDVSVTELFGWFMGGGSLTILGKGGEKDPQMILDTVAKHHITHINFVPSMFHAFLEILNHQNTYKLSHLRYIFLAGEALFPGLVNKFTGLNTKTRLENIYGPTEGTVYSSKFSLSHWDGTGSIPIGAPLRNMKLHILSKDNHLQPVGIPGELCISGVGLARGYLNNPELTAEKFDRDFWDYQDYHDEEKKVPGKVLVLSPHSPHSPHSPYSTIYRTGDLARWLTDGNIEFLGRLDHQVKIRGIRIELEEIENQLLKHEKVKEVVVLAKEDEPGDKYLCAYIVSGIPGSSRGFDVSVLREYLLKSLPAYMIPSYFMGVDEIPLTSSGKIDRKALPEPEVKPGQEYAAPRDETEKKLAELWSVILGIGKEVIGINDSFFYLGGHSLKALHMLNAIQKEFNVKIDFQDIFRYPTIAGLSRLITKSDPAVDHEIQPQPEKEYYDVSYSQWRLMVLYQLDPDSPAFNLPVRVTLYESMDETMIVKVLEKLVKRHASFRTYFKSHQGEPVQIILPQLPVNPEAMDLSHLSDTELEKNRQQLFREERLQPFKLDIPPLFRVKLIKCREEEFDLILIMHHIITDGWSMDVLKHEFTLLYEAYKKGEEYHPAPVKIRYFDYVYWHNRLLGDKEKMRQAKEFWKSQLKSDCPILELPYDYSKKNLDTKKSAAYRTVVPEKTVQELRKVAKACSASLFMVLLAGYNIMLSRITGQQDILLAVPGAARQHEDLKNIVGMFVNTLIVRNKPNPGKTFISFLENLQTNTLKVLEHQSYPLELLCSEFNITYPEIPVFFNMSTFGNTPGENLKDFASYHIEEVQQAKFDIVSYIVEYKNGIEIDTHYYKELFKPMTIEKTMKMYLLALENIVKEPGKKIEAYNLMARERKLKFSN